MEGTWISECVRGEPPAKLGAVNERETNFYILIFWGLFVTAAELSP